MAKVTNLTFEFKSGNQFSGKQGRFELEGLTVSSEIEFDDISLYIDDEKYEGGISSFSSNSLNAEELFSDIVNAYLRDDTTDFEFDNDWKIFNTIKNKSKYQGNILISFPQDYYGIVEFECMLKTNEYGFYYSDDMFLMLDKNNGIVTDMEQFFTQALDEEIEDIQSGAKKALYTGEGFDDYVAEYFGESRETNMKLNLGEGRENPYKGNFGGERTNYQIVGDDRYMKLYSKGNDKKPDELFNDVTRNYITDKEDLEAIQDLLWANNRDDEAEIVGYYIEEIDEEKKYGDNYSVARMKIDLALDNYFGGFEQVPIGDNLLLSCWEQDGRICINIEDFSDGKYGQVYNVFTPEEIMNMSREDFDRAVNDTWYYGEPNYDYDDED